MPPALGQIGCVDVMEVDRVEGVGGCCCWGREGELGEDEVHVAAAVVIAVTGCCVVDEDDEGDCEDCGEEVEKEDKRPEWLPPSSGCRVKKVQARCGVVDDERRALIRHDVYGQFWFEAE